MPSTTKMSSGGISSSSATKWRMSSGIPASTSRRITVPRRRCFSAVSKRRTRSSASSSISMSEVADDPEAALPFQGVAWEKPPGEQRDHLLEGDEAGGAGLGEIGQADEALDLRGQADERLEDLALGLHLGLALADELQRDREAEVRDERERVRRIDRERRQHRKDVVQEVVLEPGDLRLRQRPLPRRGRCPHGGDRP